MTALAVLLKSRISGLNTAVNTVWNGHHHLGRGQRQRQREVLRHQLADHHGQQRGQRHPDHRADPRDARLGQAQRGQRDRSSSQLTAGSKVYPVSSVVNVMPSWAPERWVEVIFRALIVVPRPRLARASAGSRGRGDPG